MEERINERPEVASAGDLDPGKSFRASAGIPVLPALDGFRALAILGIVLSHLLNHIVHLDSAGFVFVYGPLANLVDVLFILSGFVVFLPTVAGNGRFGNVGNYAIRRAARLLPALWFTLIAVVVMIALWPVSLAPAIPSWSAVGIHAVGMQGPVELFNRGFPLGLDIDGPLWTLSNEVIFYLLLPFVAAAFYRRPRTGLLIALAVTVGWRAGAGNLGHIADLLGIHPDPFTLVRVKVAAMSQFPSFALQFALGMAAARGFVWLRANRDEQWLAATAARVQIPAFIACVVLSYLFGRYALDGNPVAPAFARSNVLLTLTLPASIATFMVATCLARPALQRPFALPRVRELGDISYGIYLIHLPMILFIGALVSGAANPLNAPATTRWEIAALAVAAAIVYGYLSGRLLEQPIRRWAHRFGRRAGGRGTIEATGSASGS